MYDIIVFSLLNELQRALIDTYYIMLVRYILQTLIVLFIRNF